jgi:predicted alpha/beta-fold hydrolase
MTSLLPPDFRPPWWLRNGHLQTIAGHLLSGPPFLHPTRKHRVTLADGDQLVLHDARPEKWQSGDPIVTLVHGLGGCHDSGHLRRFAHLMTPLGVRTVRVDLRGTGDGLPLARKTYHAGCSGDLRAILNEVHEWSAASPLWLIGVSLGANIVLNLAADDAREPVPGLARVAALGPPLDMLRCSRLIERWGNRPYNRYFANILVRQAVERQSFFPDLPAPAFPRRTTLRMFDELYTAPRNGFVDADDYYTQASPASRVKLIKVPTLILTARDDPFIAVEPFEELTPPSHIERTIIDHGGHLAFLGPDGSGGRRWAERYVLEWILGEKAARNACPG